MYPNSPMVMEAVGFGRVVLDRDSQLFDGQGHLLVDLLSLGQLGPHVPEDVLAADGSAFVRVQELEELDRKSTRLNSSHRL